MLKRSCLWILLSFWLSGVQAADQAAMKSKLESLMPGSTIASIQEVDNTGLYEVVINGEILYFSEDMRYVFQGDVISLDTRQNLTEEKRTNLRKETLDSFNEADMIVYEPKDTKYTVTIFTDIDCGYCRKLHQQVAKYNDLGIRIRYMAFPRAGIGSESYDKAVDVWCAKDRQQAMTDAKNGQVVEAEDCDNPVQAHYEAGKNLGVTGTPALFLESGQLIPGYVPPERLKKILDENAQAES